MLRALWTSATGMQAQQMNIDVISNNLANVNTTGFKKSRIDFQDLLYTTIKAAGTESAAGIQLPTGMQVGNGAQSTAIERIFTQGDFMNTGNQFDTIIEGDGFFQVLKPDGTTAYSRDGAFKMNSEGKLVTSDGYVLQPEITVPSDAVNVSIGVDGTITAMLSGQSSPSGLGQLQLAKFVNPAGLKSLGKNLYEISDASGQPIVANPGSEGLGTLNQGFLEMSNVKVVEEMVNMIVAQRAFEINSKAIQTGEEILRLAAAMHR